jgi:hypothetical protein
MTDYTSPVAVDDVTDEMIEMVRGIIDGWYSEGRVDWEDVWDRMERIPLDDGTALNLPTDLASPVFARLKKEGRPR